MRDKIGGMPGYAYAILAAGSICWVAPFWLVKRSSGRAEKLDALPLGIVLVAIAYSMLWQNRFWARPLSTIDLSERLYAKAGQPLKHFHPWLKVMETAVIAFGFSLSRSRFRCCFVLGYCGL
jgi:hypothetical protein